MQSSGRWVVARYVGQFAVAGLIAVVIVGWATAVASRRVGEREAISEARTSTLIKAEGLVEPLLTGAIVDGDDTAGRDRISRVIAEDVLDGSLVRAKVWTADGTIIASDESRLVGRPFSLDEEELEALRTGRIEAEVSALDEPENVYERELGTKLLEVYLPVHAPDGEALLFEAYFRYDAVESNGGRLWRSFAPIALGALVMLELIQLPLAWSLARRLRQRLREREGLLERALDASEVERRQIASDLHDGVVQDLAGVAYALSARARAGTEPTADDSEALATTVRDAIRSLRSLVVDLSPPNLREDGLESALHDLAERHAGEGVRTSVDVSGVDGAVPDGVATLLYRAAQEGLRNARNHAQATTIDVSVRAEGGNAVLRVVDDGRGFDERSLAGREAEGHVGLRALTGLVRDGGGTVRVTSTPGEGTTMLVEVPLP